MTYLKLRINETGRSHLKERNSSLFNVIHKTFNNIDDLKNYLIDRYGKMPNGKRKIYMVSRDQLIMDYHNNYDIHGLFIDPIDHNEQTEIVGFLHSFWNSDISHNSKHWFQTDWISITECAETPLLIN